MRPHKVNNKNNFIAGWYSEEYEVLDRIVESVKTSTLSAPGVTYTPNGIGVNTEIKDSTDLYLENTQVYQDYINKILVPALEEYKAIYPKCDYYDVYRLVSPVNIQLYRPGQGYKNWHTERGSARDHTIGGRHLVFITYCNTVEDAGGTEFYHQDLVIKAEKGLTIIWPTDWTFTHRGVVSPSEEKVIVTGWFNYVI